MEKFVADVIVEVLTQIVVGLLDRIPPDLWPTIWALILWWLGLG